MRHRGILFAGDDPDGIAAAFELEGDYLGLEVGEETWGRWHVSAVSIKEAGPNLFHFNLDGDDLRFAPERRLDFAYLALPEISKAQKAADRNWRARRKTRKAPKSISIAASPAPPPQPAVESVERPAAELGATVPEAAAVATERTARTTGFDELPNRVASTPGPLSDDILSDPTPTTPEQPVNATTPFELSPADPFSDPVDIEEPPTATPVGIVIDLRPVHVDPQPAQDATIVSKSGSEAATSEAVEAGEAVKC